MYRIMIVDDDESIRIQLRGFLPMEKYALSLVGEASNGEEALHCFEETRPHIVVTDINIPYIDGLSLAKKVQEIDEDVQIIIVTGYGTLDFAREAIKTGSVDFLLKPLKREELNAAVKKAVNRLNIKTSEQSKLEAMETLIHEGLPILRERYLMRLMHGSTGESDTAMVKHLRKLRIPVRDSGYYFAAVISPFYGGIPSEDWEMTQIALSNIVAETGELQKISCIVIFDQQLQGIILAQSDSAGNKQLEDTLIKTRDRFQFYFPYDFSAGIGNGVTSVAQLSQSYHEARIALDFQIAYSKNNITNIGNVLVMEPMSLPHSLDNIGQIIAAFKKSESQETIQLLKNYMAQLLLLARGSSHFVQRECIKLLAELLPCCGDLRWEMEQFFKEDPYSVLLRCENPLETQKKMVAIVEQMFHYLQMQRSNRSRRVIETAIQYIKNNLSNPELRLAEVGDAVGLSTTYFSSLFSEETGMTFIEYLNQERINCAKRLLATTTKKVYEIALQVGYANPSYFFEVFKKSTGMRPKEFADCPLS